jgi:YVTN family beta-propeller protein
MRSNVFFGLAGIALVVASAAGVVIAQRADPQPAWPGSLGGGETLLPNGWRIAPAGRHMAIGDLPLNLVLSPDGRYLIVTNNGYVKPTLRVVDLEHGVVSQTLSLDDAWLGLAWSSDGTKLYSSGAAANSVVELSWRGGRLTRTGTLPLGRSARETIEGLNRRDEVTVPQSFIGGISISPNGTQLAAAHVLGQVVSLVDLATGNIRVTVDVPAEPYSTLFSKDGSTLFVSIWGGARVLLLDPKTLATKGSVAVGEHPNAMVEAPDGRVFVACANTNAVYVIDPWAMKAVEQISVALFPQAPPGSTPNALALSPDGDKLLVANADNNTVAVVDVSKVGAGRVAGFIPTGWYPTGVAFSAHGEAIYILSGKGLTSLPNPRGAQAGIPYAEGQYTGSMLQGSLSILATPDDETLRRYTNTVFRVTPYSDATRLAPSAPAGDTAIPRHVGDPSPIKHVFYVIRENRTYDQILGDLDRGNGDPTLALFGEQITPNAHALAREFVTLDNFYVDAEVSYDGHAFSTGAIATDVVEKFWPLNYGGRGAAYLSEGGGTMRNAYGNLAAPQNGYIWDSCIRAGKTVRSYGEFAEGNPSTGAVLRDVGSALSRRQAHRRVARRVSQVRGGRLAAGAIDRAVAERSHVGSLGRLSDAARDDRGKRSGARPAGRRDQPQQVLERLGDLRARRRCAERARSRRRTSIDRAGHQPLRQARQRGQHALHDVGDATDDGDDSRIAADESVRRGGAPDVQRVHEHAGAGAVHPPRRARQARRDERRRRSRRPRVGCDELHTGRHGARDRAQ